MREIYVCHQSPLHLPKKVSGLYGITSLIWLWHADSEYTVIPLYFSNMQIYNEEYVLQVVCAMECVHRDDR